MMVDAQAVSLNLPAQPDSEKVLPILLEAFLQSLGNEEYRDRMQTVVPGAEEMYGVKVPLLRDYAKQLSRAYGGDEASAAALASVIWNEGSREHKLVALFFLAELKDMSPTERWHSGVNFLPAVTNWEECDQLCAALLGPALAEDPYYMDELERWIIHENLWTRRASLVATAYLRRAKFDTELAVDLDQRTLDMAERLLDDEEKYIRKAVDWCVREVIRRHYALGQAWLMKQARAAPSHTAASTLKLAAKKLDDSDHQRFLTTIENA